MRVKISQWGNSLGLRLPKAAVQATDLKPGAEVELMVEGRDLRVRQPVRPTLYGLADLLAEMDRLGPEDGSGAARGQGRGPEITDDAYARGEITLDNILKRPPAGERRKATDLPPRKPKTNAARRRRHRMD